MKQILIIALTCRSLAATGQKKPVAKKLVKSICKAVREQGGNTRTTLDVYVTDTNSIEEVNHYLAAHYDNNERDFECLQINYFSDSAVAATYGKRHNTDDFDNFRDNDTGPLFKYYIARYIHDHNEDYKKLKFMHQVP